MPQSFGSFARMKPRVLIVEDELAALESVDSQRSIRLVVAFVPISTNIWRGV
jgi:hypothetical protein